MTRDACARSLLVLLLCGTHACSEASPTAPSLPRFDDGATAPGLESGAASDVEAADGSDADPSDAPANDGPDGPPNIIEGGPGVEGNVGAEPPSGSDDGDDGSATEPPAGDSDPVPESPPTGSFSGPFGFGADISAVPESLDGGAVFVDTDGAQKSLLDILKNHGFNYVRLRTFVEPLAPYGYASSTGCQGKAEAYNDRDHIAAFAREVKQSGMRFLLDLHYSDTWADPGKQVIPRAWRGLNTLEALAAQVRDYTVDVVQTMVDAGARPDMVQVGNEITPGMLIHVPTDNSNCFGNNSVVRPGVNGSAQNWDNLATLLSAGLDGVRQVDPSILTMLHIENTQSPAGVISWVQNAQRRGVRFDVLGLSTYEAYQGPANAWRATFQRLAETFPDLGFAVAEYNPQRRLLNDILRELPEGRGVASFFWEPTRSGGWGPALFARQGSTFRANAGDFAELDQIRDDFGL